MEPRTVVIIGTGNRGLDVYARYAAEHPDEVTVVAIAEPREDRREAARTLLGLTPEQCYRDWAAVAEQPRLADGLILSMTENERVEPLTWAVRAGYQVLTEKPIARTPEDLQVIDKVIRDAGARVMVAHVLRYQPFFVKIREIVESGVLGRLIHIQHTEGIGYRHFTHSYVRGNFRNAELGSPLIMAKNSHDLDLLVWFAGASAETVYSRGSLREFRPENAPAGSTARCTDACAVKDACPFNAERIYLDEPGRSRAWPASMVSLDPDPAVRRQALAEGPYGRCVYRSDNTTVDHHSTVIGFANGVDATLTASGFTTEDTRSIRIFGSAGELEGHMASGTIRVKRFPTAAGGLSELGVGEFHEYRTGAALGHESGDTGAIRAYLAMLGSEAEPTTTWSSSVESHWIAFAAEASRHSGDRATVAAVRGETA